MKNPYGMNGMGNKGRRRFRNKAPLSSLHPDKRHWTRKGGSWKQKVGYDSEDDAEEFLGVNPRLRAMGYRSYECPLCSKWHVGRLYGERRCGNV